MDGQLNHPSALHEWYLARLRQNVVRRGQQQKQTPMTLVGSDRARIQQLVLQNRVSHAQRSEEILAQLKAVRERGSGGPLRALNIQKDFDKMAAVLDSVASKLLAALDVPAAECGANTDLVDLTDRLIAELDQARQREKLIVSSTKDLLCCLDEDRRLLELNTQFETTTGLQKLSLLTVPIDNLIFEPDRTGFVEYVQASRESHADRLPIECRLERRDGAIIDVSWHIEWSATSSCFFCQGEDITDRKKNERLKDEIAAMIGHDLRLPATGVTLVLENLAAGIYGELSTQGQIKIDAAQDKVGSMLRLIDQLLDAEKLDAGEMPYTPTKIKLQDVYSHCFALVHGLAEKKQIKAVFPEQSERAVTADFDYSCRILFNLLTNAIKFSSPGSQISVEESERLIDDRPQVVISVVDQGPGIPEQQQSIIFERYKQGAQQMSARSQSQSQSNNHLQSKGLGLYIARRLAQLQGGAVGVTSGVTSGVGGRGSTFWFSLPQFTSSMR